MNLNGKQRAFLRGLANALQPILYVGKGGVIDTVNRQADDALAVREILKGKVQENAPITAREAADTIAAAVGAAVVQVVGHTFVLYRPAKEPQIKLPRA